MIYVHYFDILYYKIFIEQKEGSFVNGTVGIGEYMKEIVEGGQRT